jgi:hypothetical protein
MKFRPGDEHTLDVQIREAKNYHALLAVQLEQLQATQAALNDLDDPGVMVSRQEHSLKAFLWQEYHDHKHRDHIAATFLAIRRQRLLARLQAAEAALQMAEDLITSDDRLLHDLRAAVEHQRQEAARRKGQPKTQPPTQESQADLKPQEKAARPPQIDARHIYGDLTRARAQLAAFDVQVQVMRAAISPAIGWFEEFYVVKTRFTAEAREYLKRDEPIPEGVPVEEEVYYGPYLKYRWQEATDGPMYTIQMSLIPDEERAAAEHWAALLGPILGAPQDEEPWPDL